MAKGGSVAKRAFEAMMEMQRIDIAKIEAAVRGTEKQSSQRSMRRGCRAW